MVPLNAYLWLVYDAFLFIEVPMQTGLRISALEKTNKKLLEFNTFQATKTALSSTPN